MGSAVRVMKKTPEERTREKKDLAFAKKLQYQEIEVYRRKQLCIMESNENYVITPLFSQIISVDPSLQRSYAHTAPEAGHSNAGQAKTKRGTKKIIAALPTREWLPKPSAPPEDVHAGAQRQEDAEPATCMICLEEYKAGDVVKTLPCLHYFHVSCIDKWLNKNEKCPECRIPISSITKQTF